MLRRKNLPARTGAAPLLAQHCARLADLRKREAVEPLIVRTLEEALELQERLLEIKHRHRASVGWVTREELEKMARPGTRTVAREIADEIERRQGGPGTPGQS